MKNNKFDIDLAFGQDGEKWLTLLADERKIEVKRDKVWHKTGNIFFETECNGQKSGLAVTESDYFAYILTKDGVNMGVMVWKVTSLKEKLRSAIKSGVAKKVVGGDRMAVSGYLYPLDKIGALCG